MVEDDKLEIYGMSNHRSITEKTIRSHMNRMFMSVTEQARDFVPENVILGFKQWVNSEMTVDEKRMAYAVSKDILMQMERRMRIIRETLEQEVFKPFGG